MEDLNRNGRVDSGETDPLDPSDDPIEIPPVADFTYSPLIPTTSDTINFYDASSDSDGTVVAWQWNFGDGSSSTQKNPTHKYDDDGTYTVTLTVTDDDGFTDDLSKTIVVENVAPDAYIDDIYPSPATQGETVYFSGHGYDPDGSIVEYRWDSSRDGYLSSSSSFSTSSLSVGSHTIYFKVKDDDGAWSSQDTESLTINPLTYQLSISVSIVSPPILGETISLSVTLENTGTAMIPSGDYEVTISFWDCFEEGGSDSFWVWIDGNKFGNAISQIGPSESQTVVGVSELNPSSTYVISTLEFAVPDMQQPSLVLADTLSVQVSGPGVSATAEVEGLDVNLGMATYYNALVTVAVAGLGAHLAIPLASEGWAVVETAVDNCEEEWSEMVDAFNAGNVAEAAKHAARVFLGWGLWTPDMTFEERMDILVDMLVNYVKGPLSIANIIIWWVNFKHETYLSGFDLLSLSFIQAIGRSLGLSLFTDPTNLLVVDPLGRRSGFDFATGMIVNEIPNAYIYGLEADIEAIFIDDLLEGQYTVYCVGVAEGSYGLHVEVANGSMLVCDDLYSGAISSGEILTSDVTVEMVDGSLEATSSEPIPLCPTPVIPEVPWGTVVASAAMLIALVAYVTMPKWRRKSKYFKT